MYRVRTLKRADFFSDIRMRQAFTYCMDRERVITYLLYERSSIPLSYLPPDHPLYVADLPMLQYDVNEGARLLDEVGWKDTDNNPETPRQAFNVPGIIDGTPLAVNYATTKALLRQEVANLFADSMRPCGIQLNIQYEDPVQLYAPGEEGLIFGRNFDIVQLAWKAGLEPPCLLYTTEQIPTQGNHWLGVNVAGYSNPAYDQACQEAMETRSDQPGYVSQHAEAQRIFAQDIPAVPLYFRIRIAASRPDLCGLQMDTTTRSDLWNMEAFDYGDGCN
jgi:peptide/nickel transport system substrate-binding protein